MVYHQINIESYILYKVHTSELYIGAEKARKNRNILPCLLQCAFFVILYNRLNYLKISFYAFCQFYIIDEFFSNFLLTFTIFSNFFYNFFYNRNNSKSLCVNLIQKKPRKHKACGAFLKTLYDSLSCHSIYDFFKSCNVSSGNIVTFHSVTFCSIIHIVADVYHDVFQFCIYFIKCPAQSLTVL